VADTRIDELRRRLERDPGSRLFAQLAEELRKSGELVEAIRVSREGLAVHSSYPSARLTLGRALLESGDAAGGRAELESALREAPDNILASRFLAQAREALGDLKGALEQYQKTLQMAPGDRQVQAQLAAVEAKLRSAGSAAGAPSLVSAPAGVLPRTPPAPSVPSAPEPAAAASRPSAVGAAAAPRNVPPEAHRETEAAAPLPPTVRLQASQPSPGAAPPPPPPAAGPTLVPPAAAAVAPAPAVASQPDRDFGPSAPTQAENFQDGWFAPAEPEPSEPPATLPAAAPSAPRPAPEVQPDSAWDVAEAAASAEKPSPFSSSTLAELYYQQGLVDRAVDVYKQLVQQDPANEKARLRLVELEGGSAAPEDRAARRRALERTIASLEQLLAAVQRR
jgi:tetratricopeptide (TPR) repeat protein